MNVSEKKKPMMHALSRQRLVQYFFFAAFILLAWQVLRILSPFYVSLVGSAILALLVYPAHDWLNKRIPNYPSATAGVSTAAVVLIVVLPTLLFAWMAVRETGRVAPMVQRWMRDSPYLLAAPDPEKFPPAIRKIWERGQSFVADWQIDPKGILLRALGDLSRQMTGMATRAIRNTLFMTFNLIVLTFTLFFFLRDGPFLIRRGVELVPMAPRNKQAVLDRLQLTLYAVIRGVLVIAIIEGVLAGGGFAVLGVPFPVLLGLLTTIFAVIPLIGPASIWGAVAIGLALSGSMGTAILVVIWGVIITIIDNFVRPLLISADAKIPVLMLFFGIFGGLKVYGAVGLLLGPVTIALLLAFINIYRREYDWLLNPAQKGT
jgi:predicted PurR-regulated permease PerM